MSQETEPEVRSETEPPPDPQAVAATEVTGTPPTAAPRSETRYPLAYDAAGNPLRVPAHAVAWRVRRGGGKRGRPRNVFDGTTGRQLELALGASIEDLVNTNVPPDRYLLYPIDVEGTILPGIVAVTEVTDTDEDGDDESESNAADGPHGSNPLSTAAMQQETIRGQQDVIKNQSAELARALAAAVSGYAPLRPVAPEAPTPIIMEPAQLPAAPAPQANSIVASLMSIKKEEWFGLAMTVKSMWDMMKGPPIQGGGIGGLGGGS